MLSAGCNVLNLRTVAAFISPVAVWPAQNTRPGTLVAGAMRAMFSLVVRC
jgi:hypothetical protein